MGGQVVGQEGERAAGGLIARKDEDHRLRQDLMISQTWGGRGIYSTSNMCLSVCVYKCVCVCVSVGFNTLIESFSSEPSSCS